MRASQVALVMKNPPAKAGDIRDVGLIPVLGRSYGGGYGNPLQNSCLENPMDRGAWWATVHRVAKSWTQLKWLSTHAPPCELSTDTFSSVQSLSLVQLFATLWTVGCQAPLSKGFSRQEFWSGLPYPPPANLPDSGIKPTSLMSLALAHTYIYAISVI